MTSLIHGEDLVPRLNAATTQQLMEELAAVDWAAHARRVVQQAPVMQVRQPLLAGLT